MKFISSIGPSLEPMTSQKWRPIWPPWLQDGRHDLVGRPGDAFGVTSRGELTHGKVASRPRARCRSSIHVQVEVCVLCLFRLLVGNGFDPGWWLGDSRVVKGERSSCDNESRRLSFYGKISVPRIRSVILSFCHQNRSRLEPTKDKSGDISYALFPLYRPIVPRA